MSGNLFESAPSADAVFMKNFLHSWNDEDCIKLLNKCHSWNDEDCIKLLNKCHQALPDKGKLILSQAILDLTEGSDMVGSVNVLDSVRLNCLPEGGERTRKQWNDLLQAAGFSIPKILRRNGTLTKVIEAIKS